MKKIASLLLALCLVLSTVGALAEITAPGEYPIATEGETLSIWASSFGTMADFDNLPMTKWFEEKTGVHIVWTEVPNADRTAIFNTSIASGDYPDIYMMFSGNLITAAEDGVIIPLEDLIDNYMPELKAKLDANPDVRATITTPDGHIYAFPKVEDDYTHRTPNEMRVYTEWLEAYEQATGNAQPDTIEGFEEMLLWFKANDLNGNGDPNDEIIITGNSNYGLEGGYPLLYPMGAFAFVPVSVSGPNFFYVGEDGKTTTDALSDDWREGLKYCARLYSEGLIGSEAFTQSLVDMRSMTTTTYDSVKVACIPAPYAGRDLTASSDENAVKSRDYTALEPLQNYKTGEKVTPFRSPSSAKNRCVITTACENPVLAARWMDTFYTQEVTEINVYGGWKDQGDWELVEGVTSLGGEDRAIVIHSTAEERAMMWNTDWIGSVWATGEVGNLKEADEAATHSMNIGLMYLSYGKNAGWPWINWCNDADVSDSFAELKGIMQNDIYNAMTEFAMGIRDINDDKAWEDYKQALLDDGLEEFLEISDLYFNL